MANGLALLKLLQCTPRSCTVILLKILVYVTCFFLNCILHSLSVKMLTLGYSTYNLWQNCNNLRPKLKAPQIRLYWRITRFETKHCKKFARPLSFQVAFITLHFLKSWRAQFLRVSGTLRINIQLELPDLCRRARGICWMPLFAVVMQWICVPVHLQSLI